MAKKGSRKELSERHENAVADIYGGRRSASSGAAVTDEGDVRADGTLFECKGKFGELLGAHAVKSMLLKQFEKVADEAHAIGIEPALALRFYAPETILADQDGWVDLVVLLMDDDAHRSRLLAQYRDVDCEEAGRWH